MQKKLLATNTIISILYQLIVIICGFVLPRVILETFGSEINGLVNSITQFLSIISLMELGVGAVVSSALYGPLAEKKWKLVSKIVSSAEKFFKTIAKILLVYVLILVVVYPVINNSNFDRIYTGSLIVIISINSFAQYYIGVVDNIILGADQRAFIVYGTQAIAHLLNTILCIVIMHFGVGIHIVKAVTAGIYLLRPLIVRLYVKKYYLINRKKKYDVDPVGQKWNAIAQHISECVLDSTDVMILTVFSTLSSVSIYYVYNLVVYNLKNFFLISASSGVLSVLGGLYATNHKTELKKFFNKSEWVIHTLVSLLFGMTSVLIIPFITVYTNNINDANYIQGPVNCRGYWNGIDTTWDFTLKAFMFGGLQTMNLDLTTGIAEVWFTDSKTGDKEKISTINFLTRVGESEEGTNTYWGKKFFKNFAYEKSYVWILYAKVDETFIVPKIQNYFARGKKKLII